jgi:nitrite reductase/ring-hydroxylating ferredoxin subunit
MAEFLCRLAELEEAKPKLVRVKNRAVAVVRIGDEVFALDAVCPHWSGPLAEGFVSAARHEITCPWHRFRFSLRDGRCVAASKRSAVEVFPVRIEDGAVLAEVPPISPREAAEREF